MARSKGQIHRVKKKGFANFGKAYEIMPDEQTGRFLVRNATALGGAIMMVPGVDARGFHSEEGFFPRHDFADEETIERSQKRFWTNKPHPLNWYGNSRSVKSERKGKVTYAEGNELTVDNTKARKLQARVEQLSAELRQRHRAEAANEFAWPNEAVDAVATQVITPVMIDAPTMELMSRKPRWGRI